jgi:hypothetical protein
MVSSHEAHDHTRNGDPGSDRSPPRPTRTSRLGDDDHDDPSGTREDREGAQELRSIRPILIPASAQSAISEGNCHDGDQGSDASEDESTEQHSGLLPVAPALRPRCSAEPSSSVGVVSDRERHRPRNTRLLVQ